MALEEGVPIAMGTDAATPFNRHGENAGELVRMVELGMTTTDAVTSATSAAAHALGRDDVGSLRAGALADLAIWDGDPFADIRRLVTPPHAVIVGGKRIVPDVRDLALSSR